MTSKGVTQPMCMAQYYRIFATYRAPGIPKDSQFRSETEYTKARPHIIVACRGQVRFYFPLPAYLRCYEDLLRCSE